MRIRTFRVVALIVAALLWSTAARSEGPSWAARSTWPDSLLIGTASPGGTYYVYGAGLAKILTRALGIPVASIPTEGPNQNILLLESGEAKIGFVTMGIAAQAWSGAAWTGGKQYRAMRAIFPMYDTPFQFMVLQESGIQSVSQLAGKRVGIGPQAGTAGTYVPDFFKVLKIEAPLRTGEWAALAAQVGSGGLDALAVAAGVPFPSFAELEARNKVRYLPLTPDQISALRTAMPELTPSAVPAGSYPSLLRTYATVGLYNFAVAHEDLPDDLIYRLVKAVFENQDEMMEVHPAAASTVPANVSRNAFLPFHPGARRYYREIGVALPLGLGETD
jgi:hypothetical protein